MLWRNFAMNPLLITAACLGASCGISFAAEPALKTEHFDRDPNWDALNNRTELKSPPVVKQDFGYSATNFAGKASGEIGGAVTRTTRPAYYAAQVVADAMHTILCLGSKRFENAAEKPLGAVSISTYWPVEAVNLYYPQTHFFSSPYWGHACSGFTLEGGAKPTPLRLRLQDKDGIHERTIDKGISTGMGKPLTWLLPKGVYQKFTVLAGLQAGLGAKGRVEFTVLGDGKVLAGATVNGTDPAHSFECDIAGVMQLQLAAAGKGLDPKSNYAVWAEPVLRK
jgi:hypothetical protein